MYDDDFISGRISDLVTDIALDEQSLSINKTKTFHGNVVTANSVPLSHLARGRRGEGGDDVAKNHESRMYLQIHLIRLCSTRCPCTGGSGLHLYTCSLFKFVIQVHSCTAFVPGHLSSFSSFRFRFRPFHLVIFMDVCARLFLSLIHI